MEKDTKRLTVMATASSKDANANNRKTSYLVLTATPRMSSVKITENKREHACAHVHTWEIDRGVCVCVCVYVCVCVCVRVCVCVWSFIYKQCKIIITSNSKYHNLHIRLNNMNSLAVHWTVIGYSILVVINTPAAEFPSTWQPGSGALLPISCQLPVTVMNLLSTSPWNKLLVL